jgi:hypothetical protein
MASPAAGAASSQAVASQAVVAAAVAKWRTREIVGRTRTQSFCLVESRFTPDAEWVQQFTIAKSTIPDAGFGLFAAHRFEKGELLGEYTGKVMGTRDEWFGTSAWSDFRQSAKGKYVIETNGVLVDGRLALHGLQMINDARDSKANNARMAGQGLVRARKAIHPAQEIFMQYGAGFWRYENKHCLQQH